MVKLAVSALTDEFSRDIERVCEYLSGNNVHFVELRNVWKKNIADFSAEEIDQLQTILKKYNMKVSCISGGLLKCDPPSLTSVNVEETQPRSVAHNWKYNYSQFPRMLELAEILDSPYIRCFGFHGRWDLLPINQWNGWKVYQEWSTIVKDFSSKAAAKGKHLICENEGGLNKSLQHIEKIGQDHCGKGFGMLYDTANVANKYGQQGVLTDEWLGRVSKYIQYIHAKGCGKSIFGYHTILVNEKKDICRWPAILKHFSQMKPTDFVEPAPDPLFISIETHTGGPKKRWDYSCKSLQNLLAVIKPYL